MVAPNFHHFQLTEKETLDTEMLTEAIETDQYTNEFFLQKAIGWGAAQLQ